MTDRRLDKKYVDDLRKYVDEKTKAPTEKYDGEFTFVTETPTRKLQPRPSHLSVKTTCLQRIHRTKANIHTCMI